MNAAIDYVLRLANDPASGDCGKIDTTKIGATGYSLGGGGAISVGSNARITSTFFFASNGNVQEPEGSVGRHRRRHGHDVQLDRDQFGRDRIDAAGLRRRARRHRSQSRRRTAPRRRKGCIGWMRWRFMGDQAGHDLFVGATCKICSDAAFSGVVKTASLDSL